MNARVLVVAVMTVSLCAPIFAQSDTPDADRQAQKQTLFHTVDSLVQAGRDRGAHKYAPQTYERALGYRATADALFDERGPDSRALAVEIAKAEYDARHALWITDYVRSLRRKDDDWERIILLAETLLQRAADSAGATLHFDRGLSDAGAQLNTAVTTVTDSLRATRQRNRETTKQLRDLCLEVGIKISDTASVTTILSAMNDEFRLLVREADRMRGDLKDLREQLESVELERQRTSDRLSRKEAEEQKFQTVKSLFTVEEALVMYSASQDIVIRLRGLIFPSGVSSLTAEHKPLLDKVTQALNLYSDKRVVVEGHTDNTGTAQANRSVSQRRAEAVRDYLMQQTARPQEDFEAIGYGADKPVANNQTDRGRAENRRIDIVILRSAP
ncbi:MAG TPA: OmpA family protein [candidate division Zixibacteria bacterium]|nr:OmpA family protein [candidate division Zixibacteria bacterium]